jgi:NADH-quinone oxidoreductase subunit J
MALVAFLVVALIAIAAALGLVIRKNPIHGALFLVANLASVAALYLLMGFPFLAFAQVIVYAGAIMVLFVFAIMVLIPGKEETGPDPRRGWRLLAVPLGLALVVELALVLMVRGGAPAPGPARDTGVEALARALFVDYLLPFELTSLLLLAAMIGVLLLARRGRAPRGPSEPTGAAVE